jgi:hypothetical protein
MVHRVGHRVLRSQGAKIILSFWQLPHDFPWKPEKMLCLFGRRWAISFTAIYRILFSCVAGLALITSGTVSSRRFQIDFTEKSA